MGICGEYEVVTSFIEHVINQLIHIFQKEKIALEVKAKIASAGTVELVGPGGGMPLLFVVGAVSYGVPRP